MNTVNGIRSVEIEMADPNRAAQFFATIWGLSEVVRENGSIYLRGTSAAHHIVAIHPSYGPPRVRRVVFQAAKNEIVDSIYKRASAANVPAERPANLLRVDGGYGFGFCDPAGRAFAVVSGAWDHPDEGFQADKPYGIAHVNLNDIDADKTVKFFTDVVGMQLIDRAGKQAFLHADCPDHSSLVVCQSPLTTLNHLSFTMSDLESVMRGAGRMQDHGYPIEWGVGRHGCANNVFAYFAGPEEIPIEYTAEVLQIDSSYVYHGPEYWAWPPGRLDQWGVTRPHTARWRRIQDLFEFVQGGHRLNPEEEGDVAVARAKIGLR